MEQAHVQKLERLIGYDPEGCRCHEQGIARLCKAKDLGLESFAECLEEDPSHSQSVWRKIRPTAPLH
jgi:hypothetical protein